MRPALLLAVCSLLAIPLACSEKIVVRKGTPPAATEEASGDDEPPEEESPPEPPPQPPSDPLVIDLGEIETGTDVSFDVPEGALGFNIVAEGKVRDFDPYAPFGVERITDPNGKVVHSDFTPKGGTSPTSYAAFDTIATASVPQGEGVSEALAGKWTVRFGVQGSSSKKPKLKGKVRVQSSGDGLFHGGTLDLHVHVPQGLRVDNKTIDPAKAQSSASIAARIDTFFGAASELIGFDRGEVVFHEESGVYADIDGADALVQGFRISKGMADGTPALHVLLTNSISDDGKPIAVGISPGIPGAATIFGRGVSGIIVVPSGTAETDALTMLHEMGHFFGLNHTSEFDGQSFDPLSDTPKCTSIANQNYYGCPDRTNVMFPAGAIDGPVSLSVTQKRVYRGSPIYKALTKGAANAMALKPVAPVRLRTQFRLSGSTILSPVERELSMGFCGLTPLDAEGLARRHGRAEAIRQLRAAAADGDLVPFMRGRATLALRRLGAE